MSCHERPRMLDGRPSMMSEAPMLMTWRPPASAAVRATLRFSVDLYSPRASPSTGTLIFESAVVEAALAVYNRGIN